MAAQYRDARPSSEDGTVRRVVARVLDQVKDASEELVKATTPRRGPMTPSRMRAVRTLEAIQLLLLNLQEDDGDSEGDTVVDRSERGRVGVFYNLWLAPLGQARILKPCAYSRVRRH